MSDFSSLLKQFKGTARRAKEDSTSLQRKRPVDDNAKSKNTKRHRPSTEQRQSRPPPDQRDLTLNVSFFCIGAQKGGTTWSHDILRKHRSLSLPSQKEVHFWDWHRSKGLRWYSQQFPPGPKGVIKYGECTPCYVTLPERDIEEIKALFPEARLIFVARDPVDRAWSALLMELRNAVRGVEVGKFSIKDNSSSRLLGQIDRESDPDNYDDDYFMDRLRHSTHRDRCDYASGLRRWLKYFPKEQLLILDYKKIATDPRGFLELVCDHIGVERGSLLDSLTDDELKIRKNEAVGSTKDRNVRSTLRKEMEVFLQPFADEFNNLLQGLGYDLRI